jgi:hypothetical protein
MENELYIEVDSISASDEIISRIAKTQTLNIIKDNLEELLKSTTVKEYISVIQYNLILIEDCYKIDMYKFQFKAIVDMLQKDIKNLKEAIALLT